MSWKGAKKQVDWVDEEKRREPFELRGSFTGGVIALSMTNPGLRAIIDSASTNKRLTPAMFHPGLAYSALGARIDKFAKSSAQIDHAEAEGDKRAVRSFSITAESKREGLPAITAEDACAKFLYGLTYVRGGPNALDGNLYPEEFAYYDSSDMPVTIVEVIMDEGTPEQKIYFFGPEISIVEMKKRGNDVLPHWFFEVGPEVDQIKRLGLNICAKNAQSRANILRKKKNGQESGPEAKENQNKRSYAGRGGRGRGGANRRP